MNCCLRQQHHLSKLSCDKQAIKRSKRETNIHQAGGSSEGVDLESEVLDEPKGKSINTSERTGLKSGVLDVSKADSSESDYESWGDSDDDNDDDDQQKEDEFVHTPDDYLPTDDENIDDEEYDRINEEMYSDVNVEMIDTELEGEGKDDEEMTNAQAWIWLWGSKILRNGLANAGYIDVERENVNQEVASDYVKDVVWAIVTAASATQKTEVPLQSSSISSDYAIKFLNFDNIPLGDTCDNHGLSMMVKP
ncbi:hypothetical protein Tco_1492926 [Tanacetum coccineum]